MKTLLFIAACIFMHASHAQVKDKLYTYDRKWNPVKKKKAVYFLQVHQTNEKSYVRTYYNMYGPIICQESVADEAGKVRNGKCSYYYANGSLDSTGECVNDAMNGIWYFYDESGRVINLRYYEEGLLTDEIAITVQAKDLPGNVAAIPMQDEVEAAFGENQGSWKQFLLNHLHYPKRAVTANVTGTVQLLFLVDEYGNIKDPQIKKSVEYSLDQEALRIIRLSPPWIAASREGTHVKSFKVQPLRFNLEEN